MEGKPPQIHVTSIRKRRPGVNPDNPFHRIAAFVLSIFFVAGTIFCLLYIVTNISRLNRQVCYVWGCDEDPTSSISRLYDFDGKMERIHFHVCQWCRPGFAPPVTAHARSTNDRYGTPTTVLLSVVALVVGLILPFAALFTFRFALREPRPPASTSSGEP